MKIKLGSTVSDQITGFTGIVTGACQYITGCHQVLVQPPMKEGAFQESRWLDEDRVSVVDAKVISLKINNPGPDKEAPRR